MPTETLLSRFLKLYVPMKLAGRSNKTIHQHRIILRHFDRFLGRPACESDLCDETVSALRTELLVKQCAITVNKGMDKLLAQWRFLNRRGYVKTWPDLGKLPEPEIIPLGWLEDEVRLLFRKCYEQPGEIEGIPASDWWLGLNLVIYDTAERIGAIMFLRTYHYDAGSKWLHIPAEARKGKKKSKMARLHERTGRVLDRVISANTSSEFLFPFGRDLSLLYPRYSEILTSAGLPTDRRSKFHRMRRTSASHFTAAGGDPIELLDHTSRKTTLKYLDPRIVNPPQASDLLPRFDDDYLREA